MKISVILCTYNRCESLARALDSVDKSTVAEPLSWEVLIIDNNSRDQTRDIADGFCRKYPGRFRYIFESRQGKSYALNSGIREAHGDILAFMDDDVTVEPTWLQNLVTPLVNGDYAGSGGRILPARSFEPPRWLPLHGSKNMGTMLPMFDLGEEPAELRQAPYGTNMAFRKEMFQKYGDFRTDLGPRPGSEIRDEDVEFVERLMMGGERLRYVPSAVVYHAVLEYRLQKKFFLAFWFDLGRTSIRRMESRPSVWGIPRQYLTMVKHVLIIAPSKTLQWVFSFTPQDRFYSKCWVWCTAGQILEIYKRWFAPKSTLSRAQISGGQSIV